MRELLAYPNALLADASTLVPPIAEITTPTNLAAAQAEFLSRPHLVAPRYEYDALRQAQLDERSRQLTRLAVRLAGVDFPNEPVAALYQSTMRRWGDQLDQLSLMASANASNGAFDTRATHRTSLVELTQRLDATFHPIYFDNFVWRLRNGLATTFGASSTRSNHKAALRDLLPEYQKPPQEPFSPHDCDLGNVRKLGAALFGDFKGVIPRYSTELDASNIAHILGRILEKTLSFDKRWTVAVDHSAASVTANIDARRMLVPSTIAQDSIHFRETARHLSVPIMRAALGRLTGIEPLAIGTPDSAEMETGMALAFQQAEADFYDDGVGADAYLATGLLHDGHNFRQAHTILTHYYGQRMHAETTDPAHLALDLLTHVTRGTHGVPYHQPLVAANGLAGAWQYLAETIGDKHEHRLMVAGRADPRKQADREVLEAVLPSLENTLSKIIR